LLLGLSGVLKIPLLGRRQIIVLRRHRALHPRLIAAAKSITPSGQLRKNVFAGALTVHLLPKRTHTLLSATSR
jgi:hypothetical protein